MAIETLRVGGVFPVGTSVSAYAVSSYDHLPRSGTTGLGSAVATATVASGSLLTFSGLTENQRYLAYASVSGSDKYLRFSTLEDPSSQSAESTGSTTKRVTVPISGCGGLAWTDGSVVDWNNRLLVCLPFTTTRWRLRARNYSPLAETGSSGTGTVTCQGVFIGDPLFTTARWGGAFSTTPDQAIAAGLPILTTEDAVTDWVTDEALQFAARVPMGVSYGFTCPNGTIVGYDDTGGLWFNGAGKAATAGDASPSGSGSLINPLDLRLEYECEVPDGTPVIIAIGDSITQGSAGGDGGAMPHESWPGSMALRAGCPVVNLGVASSSVIDWGDATKWKWQRADLTTTVPDKAIIAIGTNDVVGGEIDVGDFSTKFLAIATVLRDLGVTEIYAATILPDNLSGATETGRQNGNDWIRGVPAGFAGVVDFDAALRVPSAQATADADFITNYPHPRRGGYQRMAAEASGIAR